MKKSYHSNTVPADEAAMTRRISLTSGFCAGGAAATLAIAVLSLAARGELDRGRGAGKGGGGRLPRQEDGPVSGRVGACWLDQGDVGPIGQIALAPEPGFELAQRTGNGVPAAPFGVTGEDSRRSLADGASAHRHAEVADTPGLVEREIHRQRASARRRSRLSVRGGVVEPREARQLDREREQLG